MSPEGVTGEVASANAWPRSPTAASRSAFGSASAAGGSTSVFGDIGIPSAPTAVVSSNFPGMPSAQNDVDVTVPVCWASRRNVAVAESPATIVSMLTVSFERSTAPLMERGSRLRLTNLAGRHRRRVGQRQRERRVADLDHAVGASADPDRPDRQPVEGARDLDLDLVRALQPPLDEELGVAALAGGDEKEIVRGA